MAALGTFRRGDGLRRCQWHSGDFGLSGNGAGLHQFNGITAGGFTSLATAGASVDVMTFGGGLVSAGSGAGGGTRLVGGVPIMMSGGTLGRGGAGAFVTFGGAWTASGRGGNAGRFTSWGGKLIMQPVYWPRCERNPMTIGNRAFCRSL
jgi:hypothetical protein